MADVTAPEIFAKVLTNYASPTSVQAAMMQVLPSDVPAADRGSYIDRLAPEHINDGPKRMLALARDLAAKGSFDAFRIALYNVSAGAPVLRSILRNEVPVDDDGRAEADALQSLKNRIEPFATSRPFLDGLNAASFMVGVICVKGKPRGTGFLIGPDLVLTAFHVVAPLVDHQAIGFEAGAIKTRVVQVPASAGELAVAFDYWTPVSKFDLKTPPPGLSVVSAAADWLVWCSENHPDDGRAHEFRLQPNPKERLDCVVIRLSRKIGISAPAAGGGRVRGWVRLETDEVDIAESGIIAILQHPNEGPQMFDKGTYHDHNSTRTRVWYHTEASKGSSGSPCFNSEPRIVAFHNAGRIDGLIGPSRDCNQGVRIDHVARAVPADVIQESQQGLKASAALWSVSEDDKTPEPILGRADFRDMLLGMFAPAAARRVLAVEEDEDAKDIGKSGKSFSIRILRAAARSRPCVVVAFAAQEIQKLAPSSFLEELARRIGISPIEGMPERPTDERQVARWCSTLLPGWFGGLIEARASRTGLANASPAPAAGGPAAGQDRLLRELIWIAIDDIHKYPPQGEMRELLAGMMAVTEPEHLLEPGLRSLRWLVTGHIPDFIREHEAKYEHDKVPPATIGLDEWNECMSNALACLGEPQKYIPAAAEALYYGYVDGKPEGEAPATHLQFLGAMAANAIRALLKRKG